jgi:hypothetical protein
MPALASGSPWGASFLLWLAVPAPAGAVSAGSPHMGGLPVRAERCTVDGEPALTGWSVEVSK